MELFSQHAKVISLVDVAFKPHKNFHFCYKFLIFEIILNLLLILMQLLHWWFGGQWNVFDDFPLGVVLMFFWLELGLPH